MKITFKKFFFLEGYVEKYKDTKRRNQREKQANLQVLDEYKRFKASAGFGTDFLDPSGVKETREQLVRYLFLLPYFFFY
jgi:hypothetical protein